MIILINGLSNFSKTSSFISSVPDSVAEELLPFPRQRAGSHTHARCLFWLASAAQASERMLLSLDTHNCTTLQDLQPSSVCCKSFSARNFNVILVLLKTLSLANKFHLMHRVSAEPWDFFIKNFNRNPKLGIDSWPKKLQQCGNSNSSTPARIVVFQFWFSHLLIFKERVIMEEQLLFFF